MTDASATGLTPEEAWHLSPREIQTHIEGWQKGQDRVNSVMAHFFASLMNVHIGKKGKRVRGRDLYNPRPARKRSSESEKAKKQAEFERAVALMGADKKPVHVIKKGR